MVDIGKQTFLEKDWGEIPITISEYRCLNDWTSMEMLMQTNEKEDEWKS